MDDLISQKEAIESLNRIPRIKGIGMELLIAVPDVEEMIAGLPSVPAVPLDKLCEWLERYATMDCDGCREAFGSCEDEENQKLSVCNSLERWEAMLTKWMEGLDAAD